MRILIGHLAPCAGYYSTPDCDVRCVKYGSDGRTPPLTIAEMLAQCPPGWRPDVYLHSSLGHFPLPTDILAFDGLTAACVSDWDRWGLPTSAGVGFLDLVMGDRRACELLRRGGYSNVHFARLWACMPKQHRVLSDAGERDIDILFCGTLCSVTWGERNRWLDRVARLSDRYRVLIATNVFGEDYVRLLNRSRIVFNRGVSGATNARCYEAAACGALVFNEAENEETKEIFLDGVHCVYYDEESLERLLEHYLEHDDERARIAAAGRELVLAEHTADHRVEEHYAILAANRETRYRPALQRPESVRAYRLALQHYSCPCPVPSGLEALIGQAERAGADPAVVLEARASIHGLVGRLSSHDVCINQLITGIALTRQAAQVRDRESRAQPLMTQGFLLAHYAELSALHNRNARPLLVQAVKALVAAAECCETALRDPIARERLRAGELHRLEGFNFPRRQDNFGMRLGQATMRRGQDEGEWEESLLRLYAWRCRSLLSEIMNLNGMVEEARTEADAAARLLPSDGESLLRLARYEVKAGRCREAAEHYSTLIVIAPLEAEIWLEYARLLVELNEHAAAERFVQSRLTVIAAMPSLERFRADLLAAISVPECRAA